MACEKCWDDAFRRMQDEPTKSQAEHYQDLILERKDRPCTPAQQRGEHRDAR